MADIKQKNVKVNMVMNALLSLSSILFPLITFPYVSRVLQPEGKGMVDFATSVISYFAMFAQLGIPTYGIRACAAVREDKEKLARTVQEILVLNLLMCLLVYAVYIPSVLFIPVLQEYRALLTVMGVGILLNAIGVEWLYKGLEQYSYITKRSVFFKLVAMVLLFLTVHSKEDTVIYGALTIFAASASNIMNLFHLRKVVDLKWYAHPQWKRHLKPVGIFFAMSVATTIYTHLDTLMLGLMTTKADVGYYGVAVKIKVILVSLVTAVSAVLLPRMTHYRETNRRKEFLAVGSKTMNFILLASTSLVLYFILFAREGVLFLSGELYEAAVVPMQIIMPTLLLVGMTNILGIQVMVPLGLEKQVLYSEILGAVVDTVLNILLIPRLQVAGAAIGTLAAEVAVWLWQWAVIRKKDISFYRGHAYGKIIAALAAGCLASLWVKWMDWLPFVRLAVSGVLFYAAYIGVLLVTKESLVCEEVSLVMGKICRKKSDKR